MFLLKFSFELINSFILSDRFFIVSSSFILLFENSFAFDSIWRTVSILWSILFDLDSNFSFINFTILYRSSFVVSSHTNFLFKFSLLRYSLLILLNFLLFVFNSSLNNLLFFSRLMICVFNCLFVSITSSIYFLPSPPKVAL